MTDKRPILFATDGSPSAAEAQHEAFELADRLGAPLLVVSVAHAAVPAMAYAGYGYADVVSELTEAEHHRVQKLLAEIEETADAVGISCSTMVADGIVADEICRIAAKLDARLIVVGSHGWGAARRLFSGSVSTSLVHSAPCAVLVVRPRAVAEERAVAA